MAAHQPHLRLFFSGAVDRIGFWEGVGRVSGYGNSLNQLRKVFTGEFWDYNWERTRTSFLFFTRVWQSFSAEKVKRVPVDNSSGGLLKPLIDPFLPTYGETVRVLLVSEPPVVAAQILEYATSLTPLIDLLSSEETIQIQTLEERLGLVWSPQLPEYDLSSKHFLNDASRLKPGMGPFVYDLVVCQSLLEHVLNPVQVIDNLVGMLGETGILALQTCNPIMRLHRFPIDTLRFHPDFFAEYGRNSDMDVFVKESGASIFAFLATNLTSEIVSKIEASFFD